MQTVNGLISVRTDRQLQALQTEELRLLQQSDESRFKGFQVSAVAVCFYGCFFWLLSRLCFAAHG